MGPVLATRRAPGTEPLIETRENSVAQDFEITDAMRSVIGVESDGWPVEFTSTGIRAFARTTPGTATVVLNG